LNCIRRLKLANELEIILEKDNIALAADFFFLPLPFGSYLNTFFKHNIGIILLATVNRMYMLALFTLKT